MTAVRDRKRAPSQGFAMRLLRLDRGWETNPASTTLLWICRNGESLPPPWLTQTHERFAVGKPTKHTRKQELDRCWSGTGLECPLSDFSLLLPALADEDKDKDRDTDTDKDLKQKRPSVNVMQNNWPLMTHKRTVRKEKSGHSHDLDEQFSHSSASSPRTLVFAMSALNLLCCACSLRMMLLGPGAEMEEHKKVSGLISDCQTCSSHVNPHATHTGAWA